MVQPAHWRPSPKSSYKEERERGVRGGKRLSCRSLSLTLVLSSPSSLCLSVCLCLRLSFLSRCLGVSVSLSLSQFSVPLFLCLPLGGGSGSLHSPLFSHLCGELIRARRQTVHKLYGAPEAIELVRCVDGNDTAVSARGSGPLVSHLGVQNILREKVRERKQERKR